MQGNWGILVLLVVAVVIYALVQAYRKPTDDDEDGEGTEAPEDGSAIDGQAVPGEKPPEPEDAEVTWAECQEQLSEAPPLSECDQVGFDEADEAGAVSGDKPGEETGAVSGDEPEKEAGAAPGDEPEEGTGRETEVEPVLPSNHALGAAIRVQAWRLFRENYRKILPLSGIVVLLMALRLLIRKTGLFPDWLLGVAGPVELFTALIAPVITLGAAFAALRLWNGEAPRARMLFHFLKERRFFPALGLMLLKGLLQLLPSLGSLGFFLLEQKIFLSGLSETFQLLSGLVYTDIILGICITVWLSVWLEMVVFAFARAPERGAMAAFKAGFRTGNHHFGSVLGMLIATGWPFFVIDVVQSIGIFWSGAGHSPVTPLVTGALSLLSVLLYGGYVLISMAGLAARLLPDEDERRVPAESAPAAQSAGGEPGGEEAD